MLTVRHVQSSGAEQVFEAQVVRLDYESYLDSPRKKLVIVGIGLDKKPAEWLLYTGVIYVMNDAGRTVAKYDFTAPSSPDNKPRATSSIVLDMLRSAVLTDAEAEDIATVARGRIRALPVH